MITSPRSNQWFELLGMLDSIPWQADPVTLDVTFLSERSVSLLSLPAGRRLPAQNVWNNEVLSEDFEAMISTLRTVAQDGTPRLMEHRMRTPTGVERWFRTAVCKAIAEDSTAETLLGLTQDVTEAQHHKSQLTETEAWLVAFAEGLPFDFWICDVHGRYVLQSPISRRFWGDARGARVQELNLPPEVRTRWQHDHEQALAGQTVKKEVQFVIQGEPRVFSRLVTPIRQGDKICGMLGVHVDITEHRQTEERLRHSLDQLARAQQQLIRQERFVAVGEMAAVMAHEVRNPLAVMFNALGSLRRMIPLHGDASVLFKALEEETTRLDQLVRNLLDFVRPIQPLLQSQAIAPILKEALTVAMRTEPAEGIRVTCRLPSSLPPAALDTPLLELALVNVIRNALQAMPNGGDLELTAECEERHNGSWLRLAIRDTGPGIPPEAIDRIFEPFFTLRPSGSGLGLALVKRIIEEHHGEIEVSSAVGHGTTFVLRLPCKVRQS